MHTTTQTKHTAAQARPRKMLFLFFNIVAIAAFFSPMRALFSLSMRSNLYSHIFLIPLVSAYLIYSERREIFSSSRPSYSPGIATIAAAIILYLVASTQRGLLNQNDYLSVMILSAVLFWIGGFVLFYGTGAFRTARFPLTFLVLMVPIPTVVVEKTVYILQHASAETSYVIFKLTGVPILREGLIFHMPRISVEIAPQCSGIRSSIALFITSILAGYLFLRRWPGRLILAFSILPITIFKNSVRIVGISLLAVYVDPAFLTNSLLHKKGGVVFFIMALAILAPLLWVLRRSEKKREPDEEAPKVR